MRRPWVGHGGARGEMAGHAVACEAEVNAMGITTHEDEVLAKVGHGSNNGKGITTDLPHDHLHQGTRAWSYAVPHQVERGAKPTNCFVRSGGTMMRDLATCARPLK